ncbi:uncharacterized protein LOC125045668 [Penaeus chinensis]|uniref:uncharacterized protein LOC125045668 n=1 Tax=Penaeus chinensis TaxID=139456 RepID=UPI001FB82618|nr:uncharacterized protein LOC125045668 [Penaeus chinensis]
MAISVVIPLLIPLEENLYNATRLLSGSGNSPLQFSESRYCVSIAEDTPTSVSVAVVSATHRLGEVVRYSITGGNDEGLFTIEPHSGLLTLAAPLDHELRQKHELQVAAEAGGQVMHVIVEVQVFDVNDNVPYFVKPQPRVTVIEEDDRDLPMTLTKVEAWDADQQDRGTLLYTLRGDGVDGLDHDKAYFKVHPHTGDLIQLRALDRDPPRGKGVWKLRVQVRDGQASWRRGRTGGPEGKVRAGGSRRQEAGHLGGMSLFGSGGHHRRHHFLLRYPRTPIGNEDEEKETAGEGDGEKEAEGADEESREGDEADGAKRESRKTRQYESVENNRPFQVETNVARNSANESDGNEAQRTGEKENGKDRGTARINLEGDFEDKGRKTYYSGEISENDSKCNHWCKGKEANSGENNEATASKEDMNVVSYLNLVKSENSEEMRQGRPGDCGEETASSKGESAGGPEHLAESIERSEGRRVDTEDDKRNGKKEEKITKSGGSAGAGGGGEAGGAARRRGPPAVPVRKLCRSPHAGGRFVGGGEARGGERDKDQPPRERNGDEEEQQRLMTAKEIKKGREKKGNTTIEEVSGEVGGSEEQGHAGNAASSRISRTTLPRGENESMVQKHTVKDPWGSGGDDSCSPDKVCRCQTRGYYRGWRQRERGQCYLEWKRISK